jgi:NADPH:quinone reductase-like Zn-dependent oxidoreductase
MSATMQAIRQQALGGPEVLELTEMERSAPLPTEVLVRVRAVGVNPVEAVIRSGRFPLLGEPPFILGWDVCGVVEDIEPGVTRPDKFEGGLRVYFSVHRGWIVHEVGGAAAQSRASHLRPVRSPATGVRLGLESRDLLIQCGPAQGGLADHSYVA